MIFKSCREIFWRPYQNLLTFCPYISKMQTRVSARYRYREKKSEILTVGVCFIGKDDLIEANAEFHRIWREHFGASVKVATRVWLLMEDNKIVENESKVDMFIWALHFMKCYPTDNVGASRAGVGIRHYRTCVADFVNRISWLENAVVSKPLFEVVFIPHSNESLLFVLFLD